MAGLTRVTQYFPLGTVERRTFPVLSTATFKKGDFLTFDTNGKLTQTLTAANNAGSGLFFVGQAEHDSKDDNGNVRPYASVVECKPGVRFVLPIYHGTAASAIFTPGTSTGTKSQDPAGYELRYVSATAGFAVDISANTNKYVRILDVIPDDYQGGLPAQWPTYNGAGTIQYPWVIVEFIGAGCALTGAR